MKNNNLENKHKKRKDDIFINEHLHSLAIFSFLIFLILIYSLESSPKIYADFYNKFNLLSHKYFNNKDIESKLPLLFKDRQKKLDPKSYFDNLNIQGKSYIIYDVKEQNIIYSKNENDILPLASLTKVIAAITANKLADKNTNITIKKNLMRKDESLDIGMKEGQIWKMNDLLKYALTISSNSSMDIIAGTVLKTNSDFVDNMNTYTKDLGYKNFHFNSASGLDYGDVIGGEGTALEYAKLFAKSYELIPDIMSYTINSKVNLNSNSQKIYQVPNTNKSASEIIGLMASKTGFTDAAGGNLAILYEPEINKPIIIVVLGSTFDERFVDVNKLLASTNEFLEDSSR